jgi:hypothetical protein
MFFLNSLGTLNIFVINPYKNLFMGKLISYNFYFENFFNKPFNLYFNKKYLILYSQISKKFFIKYSSSS